MRTTLTLFSLLLLLLLPTMALSAPDEYEETVIAFRSFQTVEVVDLTECHAIGAPYWEYATVAIFDIYSISTTSSDGSVSNDMAEKIGHVLTCSDSSNYDISNWRDPIPANFKIVIGDLELIAEGEGRYHSLTVPELGVALGNWTLTIQPDPPEILGGLLTTNTLSNFGAPPAYVVGSFSTVRLFTPRQDDEGDNKTEEEEGWARIAEALEEHYGVD